MVTPGLKTNFQQSWAGGGCWVGCATIWNWLFEANALEVVVHRYQYNFFGKTANVAALLAGKARTKLGEDMGLIEEGDLRFRWIVDFPMYEWNEHERGIDVSNISFSMPWGGFVALPAMAVEKKD